MKDVVIWSGERVSEGAKLLRAALRERGLNVGWTDVHYSRNPNALLLNWGVRVTGVRAERGKILNASLLPNKLLEAEELREGGVETIRVMRDPKKKEGWLPRTLHHVGGRDLLATQGHEDRPLPFTPAFWTKKEEVVRELRYHIFLGKSIRAGGKIHRDGWGGEGQPTPHPWIRSLDSGWRVSYGESPPKRYRDLAKRALEVLGYDFGAVDIGIRADGSALVFEVNTAPGMEEGTAGVWAEAIKREFFNG